MIDDKNTLHKPVKMPQSEWDTLVAKIHLVYGYADGTWDLEKFSIKKEPDTWGTVIRNYENSLIDITSKVNKGYEHKLTDLIDKFNKETNVDERLRLSILILEEQVKLGYVTSDISLEEFDKQIKKGIKDIRGIKE